MGKRFNDIPIHSFSFWSDMIVECPECGMAGTVSFDKEFNIARFRCYSCFMQKDIVPCGTHAFEITGQCVSTGKYFRTFLAENQVHGQKQKIKCPYCKEYVIGDVIDKRCNQPIIYRDIRNAKDPYFQYPFYFQTSFRGKTIWALNREHLQYLIDYLSADLRTVQPDYYENYKIMRSQSDVLPTFMKSAKNRDGIVKALIKLQAKGQERK